MFGAALWFTWFYGSKYPYFDDFGLVLWLSGEFPVTPQWLWEQYNDHRIPLPRLLWVLLYRLFGGDFRAGMVFNVLLIGALTFAWLRAAKRIRGRPSYGDAFFPVLLLAWQGKLSFFLWSFILQLALSTALAGGVLAIIAGSQTPPSAPKLVVAGLCVILLPLCGANGLVLVPALAVWLAGVGLYGFWAGAPRRGAVALFLAILAAAVVVLYYVGFDRTKTTSPELDLGMILGRLTDRATWESAFMFISMGLGMSSNEVFHFVLDGLRQVAQWIGVSESTLLWSAGAAALLLVSAPLLWVWIFRPAERFRAFGLTCFLAACASLTLAIGIGRGGEGLFHQYRYIVLATPLWALLYFVWAIVGGPAGRLVQMSLFTLFCVLLPRNIDLALQSAREDRAEMQRFEDEMKSGLPLLALADRYSKPFLIIDNPGGLTGYFHLLKKHGDNHYADLQHDDLPLGVRIDFTKPLPPGLVLGEGWHPADNSGRRMDAEGVLKFWLPETRKVQPLRLRVIFSAGARPLGVILNGAEVGTLTPGPDASRPMEITLPPAESLEVGPPPGKLNQYNVLKFVDPQAPAPPQSTDDGRAPPVSVAWAEFVSIPPN
jgi:hypothetical protein